MMLCVVRLLVAVACARAFLPSRPRCGPTPLRAETEDDNLVVDDAARASLEKLALMTEPCREEAAWRTGATLSQQRAFGPTLQQRMDQANSQGRIAMVSAQCDEVKGMMRDNIELLLARGDKLDELEEKAGALATISKQFHKGARHAKRAARE